MPRKKDESIESQEQIENNETVSVKRPQRTIRVKTNKTKALIKKKSFYGVDYNELDKNLSPEQKSEWTAIYASFRSKTPLTGNVMGVDRLTLDIANPVTKKLEPKQILCLVVMNFRAKVIIPQTEIWYDGTEELPDYVIKGMVGAKIDYVITNVDRVGEVALASRRMALHYVRNRFFRDSRAAPGQTYTCNVLVVGPGRIVLECGGFDFYFKTREFSYTSIADLRNEYQTGQEIKAKIIKANRLLNTLEISVKEVNPNPFYGAEERHPIGSIRQAIISGSYAGGVFCRMADDTTCLCLYSPNYFKDTLYAGDSVRIAITRYDYDKNLIYGKITAKI